MLLSADTYGPDGTLDFEQSLLAPSGSFSVGCYCCLYMGLSRLWGPEVQTLVCGFYNGFSCSARTKVILRLEEKWEECFLMLGVCVLLRDHKVAWLCFL